jgi:hypothetical protein
MEELQPLPWCCEALCNGSLLQYPHFFHEFHHHQLNTLTQEFLKAKEKSYDHKPEAKAINHYSLLVILHYLLTFFHQRSLLLQIEEDVMKRS